MQTRGLQRTVGLRQLRHFCYCGGQRTVKTSQSASSALQMIISYIIENALASALVLLLSILKTRLQGPGANPTSPSHRY